MTTTRPNAAAPFVPIAFGHEADADLQPFKRRADWFVIPAEQAQQIGYSPGVQFDEKSSQWIIHRNQLPLLGVAPPFLHVVDGAISRFGDGTTILRPRQVEGVHWMLPRRGLLNGDGMRLGKTAQAVAVHDPDDGPMVVAGPLATRRVWLEWFARRWPGEPVAVLTGRSFDPERVDDQKLVFMHHDVLQNWMSVGLGRRIGTFVLDEVHRFSNRGSLRTQAALMMAPQAERVITLSGTPLWNSVAGLWSILSITNPSAWGTFTDWTRRYCLTPESKILRPDGSYVSIGSLSVGDAVVGWGRNGRGNRVMLRATVERIWRREAFVYEVTLASGRKVTCTPDHHWYAGSSLTKRRQYRPLFSEHHRRQWRHPMRSLFTVAPPSVPPVTPRAYMLGYIWGLMDGDGSRRHDRHGYKSVITAKEREHLDVALEYATSLGLWPKFGRRKDGMFYLGFWRKAVFKLLTGHVRTNDSFRRGWLAGIYDAEGSYEAISQYETVNRKTYSRIVSWLKHFGFDIHTVPKSIRIRGGAFEMLRFYGLVEPKLKRKIDAYWARGYAGRIRSIREEIVSIEPAGIREVVSIQTSTGNYVVDGIGSKNCNGRPGAYGWITGDASCMDEFRARMSETMIRRRWIDAVDDLIPTKRTLEVAELNDEKRRYLDVIAMKLADGTQSKPTLVGEMARYRRLVGKFKGVAAGRLAARRAEQEPVVVWTWHHDVAKTVVEMIPDGILTWVVTGNVPEARREDILDAWRADPHGVLVMQAAIGQAGIDLSHARLCIFAELDWTPAVIGQAEMRTFSPDRGDEVVYVVADHDIDRRLAAVLAQKCTQAMLLGTPAADTAIDTIAAMFQIEQPAAVDLDDLARRMIEKVRREGTTFA